MSHYRHKLNDLLVGLEVSGLSTNPEVTDISLDSRTLHPGGLFIALKGEHVDAREFIPMLMQQGAVAVLIDGMDLSLQPSAHQAMQNVITVVNLRTVLSGIAARFYNQPSRALKVIGITGTNGKTTIAWYLTQVLNTLGIPAGIMGTLGAGRIETLHDTGLTTPDAVQVQKHLADMRMEGVQVVCMEVSSHGLELGRVNDVFFDSVVFSNLSQDHLDFHQTMEQYAKAKLRLFQGDEFSLAIVNGDDDLGQKLVSDLGDRCFSYGIDAGKLFASNMELTPQGLSFSITHDSQSSLPVQTRLIGKFNVYNMLAVIGAGMAQGFALPELIAALATCSPVPGRMERIDELPEQPVVVVDYAHTPDALDKALSACRNHCRGSLSVVFGCGGDRDKAKRPKMGRIAEHIADSVFITDDNPRSEQPAAIIADIQRGMTDAAWVFHDRAQAINVAISRAQANDWVLIAGKGHEPRQVYADRVIDFDDRAQAISALERLAA